MLAVAGAVLVLAAGATTTVGARAAPDTAYVALGDSYTAGPVIPPQDGVPGGCLRTSRNYPHVVAAILKLSLHDVSCSSAKTDHLFGPQAVTGGPNPPQLDAVGAGTGIVTVGIGGNDIGFGEIVTACVALLPTGSSCQGKFAGPAGDEISRRIAATAPKVRAVVAEIHRRAPAARVFLVGYPAILPEHDLGCWPFMPIALEDVAYLRGKQKELNAMIAASAAAEGATFVDLYTPSLGKDACALPGFRWVEPVVPISLAAPVHPNAEGMQAMGGAVAAAIAGTPYVPTPGLDARVELGLLDP